MDVERSLSEDLGVYASLLVQVSPEILVVPHTFKYQYILISN